jgi:Caspase domain
MRFILAIVLFSIFLAGPAWAERRVALVVGNDRYDELSADEQLHNAVNDARAVKVALEQLKFEVDIGENLDRKQFIEKLSDFGGRLQDGDIAFFFYAGHGVSFSGANYLLPRDIPQPRANARDEESRLADLAVAETRVVERIRAAGARVAVIVLDACRDNPLAPPGGRSIGGERGLQPPPQTRGVLTIYSAGVGQKATDLGEGNSLFTGVLVKELTTPGLGLREVAFKTQGEVAALASEQGLVQEPGVYSEIIGDDVYLAGARVAAPIDAIGNNSHIPNSAAGEAVETPEPLHSSSFPIPSPPAVSPNTSESGRYKRTRCGSIVDSRTRREWFVGPDADVSWTEAQLWARNLSACGKQWDLPSIGDLRSLFDKEFVAGTGYFTSGRYWPAHIEPIFSAIGQGSWVWAQGEQVGGNAPAFNFNQGVPVRVSVDNFYGTIRAFAVAR